MTIAPKKICFIGSNTTLWSHFKKLGYTVSQYGRNSQPKLNFCCEEFRSVVINIALSENQSKYLICSGKLQSIPITEPSLTQIRNSFQINAAGPIITGELSLKYDPNARIIILGSESGKRKL